jgi:acyl carrier protein
MSEKLYGIISKVFNFPISDITDSTTTEDIPRWTSFNGYVLLYELETNFDVKFTIDEATDVKNISDIKRHLKSHGVDLDD